MVDVSMLISGIIALAIGIILYAIKTYLPPGANKAAIIGGIVLSVIGVILIILSVILPLIAGYP